MQSNSPAPAGPAGPPRVLTDANIVFAAPARRCVRRGRPPCLPGDSAVSDAAPSQKGNHPGAPGPVRGCDAMTKGYMFRHPLRFPPARGSGATDARDLGQKHWRTWAERSKVLDGKEVTGV